MPVLSVAITSTILKVSVAGKERMMAFFFAMRLAPVARIITSTAGSPSGIPETNEATANVKISAKEKSRIKNPTKNVIKAPLMAMIDICLVSLAVLTSK